MWVKLKRLRPCPSAVAQLDPIPGIGIDMRRFPDPSSLSAAGQGCTQATTRAPGALWAMRRSGRTRKGSPWLRTLRVQAAHAGARKKDTDLGAHYRRRLFARRGKSRTAVAVGQTILVIAYPVLRDGPVYHDLGPHDVDERDRRAVERRLVHRLEGLGSTVSLKPAA